MLMEKKAFLFDMDGLLVDTERIHLKMWHQLFTEKKMDVDMDILKSTIGVSEATEKKILQEALGDAHLFSRYQSEKDELMKDYLQKEGLPSKAGAKAFLEYLHDQRKTVILVSSSYAYKVKEYLGLAGLEHLLVHRVCGDDVKEAKPSPEIYLLALKKYQLTPKQCIVFEDSRNGILASERAGIDVIGIPDLVNIQDVQATHLKAIYPSLGHVLEIMQNELNEHQALRTA